MTPREGSKVSIQPCLAKSRVFIVDVETTGFSPSRDRVIELGVIWIEQGRLVMSYGTTFNPRVKLPQDIVRLTGITQKEVDQSPGFDGTAGFVVDLLERPSVIVAYNSSFDLGFLRKEIERAGKKVPQLGFVLDPLKWVRKEDRGKKCGLGEVAKRREIPVKDAHRALADCWMTLAVMNTLKMPSTLGEAVSMQRGTR